MKISDLKIKSKKNKYILNIVLAVLMIYFAYVIYLLVKQPTDIFTVEEGKLYSEESDIGYVIRDEVVVRGNQYKNGMEQIKNEGEKVAKNEDIFRYYSKNEESLVTQIAELDTKIQEALKSQEVRYLSDVKILEEQIDQQMDNINKMTDISKITECEKQINQLITKKAKIVGEKSPSGSYLKELNDQRAKLEQELNNGSETITAPKSGILSYRVDGLEDKLTVDNFSSLSEEFLENLNLKTGKLIATSDECGKIVDNFTAYIATISTSEQSKQAKIGDKVKIKLSNSKEIDAEISYISQENEEKNTISSKN